MNPVEPRPHAQPAPITAFLLYFLKLGTLGFGGPIALAGHMQRDLVEERGWISRQDYLDGLALAQLAPGPLAAQLAMYLGYVRAGLAGDNGYRSNFGLRFDTDYGCGISAYAGLYRVASTPRWVPWEVVGTQSDTAQMTRDGDNFLKLQIHRVGLSKEQQALYKRHAPDGLELDDLSILQPPNSNVESYIPRRQLYADAWDQVKAS